MTYPLHPSCALWPRMPDDQLTELAADIKANGLHHSIIILDGLVLDGADRQRACKLAGVIPRYEEYTGDDPDAFVLSMNRHRKHLNEAILAFVCAEMVRRPRGGQSGNANAAKTKVVNTSFVSGPKTVAEIAKAASIPEHTIYNAKTILDKGIPELRSLVENGKAGIRATADYTTHTPKDKQVADPKVIRSRRTTSAGESSATIAVREYVRPLVERDEPINVQDVAKATGFSRIIAEAAIAAERGRQEGFNEAAERGLIDQSLLSKTAQERLAIFERRLRAQMEAEFEQRVREEVERRLAARDKQDDEVIEQANALVFHHGPGRFKPPFTPQEYYALLWALHPDNNDQAKAAAAFVMVRQKKLILCDEGPIKRKSDDAPLPKTVADLMAMRKSKSKVA